MVLAVDARQAAHRLVRISESRVEGKDGGQRVDIPRLNCFDRAALSRGQPWRARKGGRRLRTETTKLSEAVTFGNKAEKRLP